MQKLILLTLIFGGSITAVSAETDPSLFYCQGKLPGYGYRLKIVDPTTIEILSVTSFGRFMVDPLLPKQGSMISLRGALVGIQHKWKEDRVIRVSESLIADDEFSSEKILELSGVPFYCTNSLPPNFQ